MLAVVSHYLVLQLPLLIQVRLHQDLIFGDLSDLSPECFLEFPLQLLAPLLLALLFNQRHGDRLPLLIKDTCVVAVVRGSRRSRRDFLILQSSESGLESIVVLESIWDVRLLPL